MPGLFVNSAQGATSELRRSFGTIVGVLNKNVACCLSLMYNGILILGESCATPPHPGLT